MLAQPVACTCTARCRTMPIEGKRRASCLLFQTDLGAASCEMQDTSSYCSFCLNQRQPKTAQPEKTRNSNMGKIFPLHKSLCGYPVIAHTACFLHAGTFVDKDRLGKGERRDLQSNSIISIGLSPRIFKVIGMSTAAL